MTTGGFSIRTEQTVDQAGVYAVNAAAFPSAAEATIVDCLRNTVDPLISLVAGEGYAIVGHIMFSPVTIDSAPDATLLGLAPMAVLPNKQNQGIGSALVLAGLQACREIGTGAVVVLGHPEYYPRFGFVTASSYGIACEYDAPDEVFMAIELVPGCLDSIEGTVSYDKAFAG